MTIGFKVQVVIRYKDSLCALPLHSQSYYERISICRVSFTHQANSFENRDEKIENIVRIHIYMIIATLAAENSNKQTLRIKKQEHELCRIKLFYHL